VYVYTYTYTYNYTYTYTYKCIYTYTYTHAHTHIHKRRHDTTAFMLSWILIEIYRTPNVLDRLRAELDEVNPTREHWAPEKLRSLKYLEATINEGMR
jgi:hypothetical protein